MWTFEALRQRALEQGVSMAELGRRGGLVTSRRNRVQKKLVTRAGGRVTRTGGLVTGNGVTGDEGMGDRGRAPVAYPYQMEFWSAPIH